MRKVALFILLLTISTSAMAQAIGDVYFYNASIEPRHVRFTYDNDFFTATDRYYTQGIQVTIANPALRHNPLSYLLINSRPTSVHGISIEHNAYTPTNITIPVILYGDRPYTAALMLSSFAINTDQEKAQRWTSSLSLGVLGRAAGGEWMQRGIHEALDNVEPKGWKFQLRNAPILNYKVDYERNLVSAGNHLSLAGIGSVSAGTLTDKADIGINVKGGAFDPVYSASDKRKFRVHIYAHPAVSFIAYDATLQGGIFTKGNIYSIPAKDIERVVFNGRSGIVFSFAGITLEHFYTLSSKAFSTQDKRMLWGGVSMSAGF